MHSRKRSTKAAAAAKSPSTAPRRGGAGSPSRQQGEGTPGVAHWRRAPSLVIFFKMDHWSHPSALTSPGRSRQKNALLHRHAHSSSLAQRSGAPRKTLFQCLPPKWELQPVRELSKPFFIHVDDPEPHQVAGGERVLLRHVPANGAMHG